MSCKHCEGTISPVVIDKSLSIMVTVQAKYIHQLEGVDEVLEALKRMIEAEDTEGAINMIDSHFKNQRFKGNDED